MSNANIFYQLCIKNDPNQRESHTKIGNWAKSGSKCWPNNRRKVINSHLNWGIIVSREWEQNERRKQQLDNDFICSVCCSALKQMWSKSNYHREYLFDLATIRHYSYQFATAYFRQKQLFFMFACFVINHIFLSLPLSLGCCQRILLYH